MAKYLEGALLKARLSASSMLLALTLDASIDADH